MRVGKEIMRPEIKAYHFDWMLWATLEHASKAADGTPGELAHLYRYIPYYKGILDPVLREGEPGIVFLKCINRYLRNIINARREGKKVAATTFCFLPWSFLRPGCGARHPGNPVGPGGADVAAGHVRLPGLCLRSRLYGNLLFVPARRPWGLPGRAGGKDRFHGLRYAGGLRHQRQRLCLRLGISGRPFLLPQLSPGDRR